ncbi:hypothetical protein [Candidatus Lokiarchaeum ossiferum]|uniref:hypothetical protein n=1 Tax=Candidatus Lokiarchaeum ossiferum TaxID=2951803 RepID=UPI00352F71F2
MERSGGKEIGGMREKNDRELRKRGILVDFPQRAVRKGAGGIVSRTKRNFHHEGGMLPTSFI